MEKGWELLNLCREMMKEEGYHWQKSKDRREEENRRKERIAEAAAKREKTLERLATKKLQTKITETLLELPENRRIILEGEMEKERRMILKEAKQEIWKKWRQSKGKRKNNPKIQDTKSKKGLKTPIDELEGKLAKIEKSVESYKADLERMKKDEQEKTSRLDKKKKLEGHWEMLRWITNFMDENEKKWSDLKRLRRQERADQEKKEEWESRSKEEKMAMIRGEEAENNRHQMTNKEGRLEEAQRLKRSWREWEERGDLAIEKYDYLDPEDPDFLGTTYFCLNCTMSPCCCLGSVLDRRIEMIRLEDEIGNLERKVSELRQEQGQNSSKYEELTIPDPGEGKIEQEKPQNKTTSNIGPRIGELGAHNKVESGGNGAMAQARTHPSLNIDSSELRKILSRPPKGGEPLEGSKHEKRPKLNRGN